MTLVFTPHQFKPPKSRPAALEIEASARQLPQNQLGIVQAVLDEQDPELLGHVERRFHLSPRVPREEAR
jgi:hypothetical protein